MLHSSGVLNILNRKAITKSFLFKYLNKSNVSVSLDYSKQILIETVLQFWSNNFKCLESIHIPDSKSVQCEKPTIIASENITQQNRTISEETEQFPIHLMARKFADWFFDEYNKSTLNINDFWSDAVCEVHLVESEISSQQEVTTGAHPVFNLLSSLKEKYEFFFNPNVSHSGIQGRIDSHGMVLVLCCGTLHTQSQGFIGVFECAFGLIRDPFTDNNWKIKHMRLRLQSTLTERNSMPSLLD